MKQAKGFVWTDVASCSLTQEDKEVLAHPAISGVVLFAKNFESPEQLRALVHDIRSVSADLIVTADQEGGRVQRFCKGFTSLPAMSYWGCEYQTAPEQTAVALRKTLTCMVDELHQCGVYASIAPVLDIDYGHNQVIGERSFGASAKLVTKLGNLFIDTMHSLKMPVIGKHFPGHGWVSSDSHETLPVDQRSLEAIIAQDLQPFKQLAPKLDAIMPAHIVYSAVDQKPAGFSRFWLQLVLREQCQFDGLIVTDDLTMQGAASLGDYITRAELALDAGVDVVLVCNSRQGTVDILDRVKVKYKDSLPERLHRYARFQQ